jgi:thioredoxin-related protein
MGVLGQSKTKFASGEKWDLRVLSFENTGKRQWNVANIKSQYAELNDPSLTFWRVKGELTPKIPGYLKSDWFELIYTTQDGKKKASNSVAHIPGIMGNKAMMGSSTISFSKLNPIKLDLLFAGPKNADDVKFIQLKLQNLSIPLIHE